MSKDFNLKKYLFENRLGAYANIHEELDPFEKKYTDKEEWKAAVKAQYPNAKYTKGVNTFVGKDGEEIPVPYDKYFLGFQTLADWNEKDGFGKIYKTKDISSLVYPKGSKMD